MELRARLISISFAMTSAGCTTLLGPEARPPNKPAASFFAPAYYADETFEKAYEKIDLGKPLTEEGRRFVAFYIRTIDTNYAAYTNWLSSGRASIDVTYDSLGLATTGLSAISLVPSIKTGLAAIGTFAQGQKSSIEKNYYQGKVIFTLISVMEISRADLRSKLRRALQSNTYTLQDALFDLEEYYKVGTIDIALTSTSVNAAADTSTPSANTPTAAASAADNAASAVTAAAAASSAASSAEGAAIAASSQLDTITKLAAETKTNVMKAQISALAASAAELSAKASVSARQSLFNADAANAAAMRATAAASAAAPKPPSPDHNLSKPRFPSTSPY